MQQGTAVVSAQLLLNWAVLSLDLKTNLGPLSRWLLQSFFIVTLTHLNAKTLQSPGNLNLYITGEN